MDIKLPAGTIRKIIKNKSIDFIYARFPFEAEDFTSNSAAKKAGIRKGDRIIGIDTVNTLYFDEFRKEVVKYKGKNTVISVLRNKKDTVKVNIKVNDKGLIGIQAKSLDNYFEFKKIEYSFIAAIPAGTAKAYKMLGDYIKQLKLIFSPETKAYESVGGFIRIGSFFPSEWDWQAFWSLTAFLSVMLAFLNILPIPALDGGYIIFLLYEMITGRKPNEKVMEYAQITGMILLLALLLYANGNDVVQLFKK